MVVFLFATGQSGKPVSKWKHHRVKVRCPRMARGSKPFHTLPHSSLCCCCSLCAHVIHVIAVDDKRLYDRHECYYASLFGVCACTYTNFLFDLCARMCWMYFRRPLIYAVDGMFACAGLSNRLPHFLALGLMQVI